MSKISVTNNLEWLQQYYLSLCDGDWEHGYGFEVATLDNPGWRFKFDTTDTSLGNTPFEGLKTERSDDDWMVCRLEGKVFNAYCGPMNLDEVISIFRAWVENADSNEASNV